MRYLNRATTKEGFVDLHNHTSFSYGRELGQINFTPLQYLEECREYADKYGKQVSFAITDHNNTNGNLQVLKAIKENPDKYKNVNFIPGCEYTVSTDSIGHVYDENGIEKPIVSSNKIHLLAYGMNMEDPTIMYLSSLMSNERKYLAAPSSKSTDAEPIDNSGYIEPIKYGNVIFCTKKWLRDKNMEVEIKEFAKTCQLQESFGETVDVVEKFLKQKFNFSKEEMNDWKKFVNDEKNLRKYVKADVQEVMDIVQSAGGYTVIAHPVYCGPSETIQNLANSKDPRNEKFKDIAFRDVNHKNMTDAERKENLRKMGNYFDYIYKTLTVNARNPITGKKLDGVVGHELLHCANQKNPYIFDTILKTGDKYGLYCTSGSDSHGDLHRYSIPSRMCHSQIQNAATGAGKKFNGSAFATVKCKFVEDFMEAQKNGTKLERCEGRKANDQLSILQTFNNKERYYTANDFRDLVYRAHKVREENKLSRKIARRRNVIQYNNEMVC